MTQSSNLRKNIGVASVHKQKEETPPKQKGTFLSTLDAHWDVKNTLPRATLPPNPLLPSEIKYSATLVRAHAAVHMTLGVLLFVTGVMGIRNGGTASLHPGVWCGVSAFLCGITALFAHRLWYKNWSIKSFFLLTVVTQLLCIAGLALIIHYALYEQEKSHEESITSSNEEEWNGEAGVDFHSTPPPMNKFIVGNLMFTLIVEILISLWSMVVAWRGVRAKEFNLERRQEIVEEVMAKYPEAAMTLKLDANGSVPLAAICQLLQTHPELAKTKSNRNVEYNQQPSRDSMDYQERVSRYLDTEMSETNSERNFSSSSMTSLTTRKNASIKQEKNRDNKSEQFDEDTSKSRSTICGTISPTITEDSIPLSTAPPTPCVSPDIPHSNKESVAIATSASEEPISDTTSMRQKLVIGSKSFTPLSKHMINSQSNPTLATKPHVIKSRKTRRAPTIGRTPSVISEDSEFSVNIPPVTNRREYLPTRSVVSERRYSESICSDFTESEYEIIESKSVENLSLNSIPEIHHSSKHAFQKMRKKNKKAPPPPTIINSKVVENKSETEVVPVLSDSHVVNEEHSSTPEETTKDVIEISKVSENNYENVRRDESPENTDLDVCDDKHSNTGTQSHTDEAKKCELLNEIHLEKSKLRSVTSVTPLQNTNTKEEATEMKNGNDVQKTKSIEESKASPNEGGSLHETVKSELETFFNSDQYKSKPEVKTPKKEPLMLLYNSSKIKDIQKKFETATETSSKCDDRSGSNNGDKDSVKVVNEEDIDSSNKGNIDTGKDDSTSIENGNNRDCTGYVSTDKEDKNDLKIIDMKFKNEKEPEISESESEIYAFQAVNKDLSEKMRAIENLLNGRTVKSSEDVNKEKNMSTPRTKSASSITEKIFSFEKQTSVEDKNVEKPPVITKKILDNPLLIKQNSDPALNKTEQTKLQFTEGTYVARSELCDSIKSGQFSNNRSVFQNNSHTTEASIPNSVVKKSIKNVEGKSKPDVTVNTYVSMSDIQKIKTSISTASSIEVAKSPENSYVSMSDVQKIKPSISPANSIEVAKSPENTYVQRSDLLCVEAKSSNSSKRQPLSIEIRPYYDKSVVIERNAYKT